MACRIRARLSQDGRSVVGPYGGTSTCSDPRRRSCFALTLSAPVKHFTTNQIFTPTTKHALIFCKPPILVLSTKFSHLGGGTRRGQPRFLKSLILTFPAISLS